ncbi:beta-xylosidase [Streptomyces sp. NPDC059708]|uniref:beta-xylosidase n=1 Tax=Streptomyces sp. NPDC059708 TaxID=3346916 RepID=UPI0036857036
MRRGARGRSWAAAAGIAVLAAAAAAGTPAAADGAAPAGRVEFPAHCLPSAEGTTAARVEADDPAPAVGDTVTVTYRLDRTPAETPPQGGTPAATGRILLGGAQGGEVPVAVVAADPRGAAEGAAGEAAHRVAGPAGAPRGAAEAEPSGVVMSGSFTVTEPGEITLAPGGYALPGAACAPAGAPAPVALRILAVRRPVMNLRGVALAASYGEPGARVRVSGAGFTPGAAVTVAGRAGAAGTADRVAATADAFGAFAAELGVEDRRTTGVVAYEGPSWTAARGSGPAAYAVVEPAAPAAGSLTMTQAGAAVTLGAVGYGGGGAAAGRIGTVTVTDTRGPGAGRWTLRGRLDGVLVPGASLSWAPSCGGGCEAGAPGAVGPEGAVLASGAGGTSTVDAALTLRVPAYTPPGAYRAALTLTLS